MRGKLMPNLKEKEYKKLEILMEILIMLEKMEASIRVQGNLLLYLTILNGETFKRSLIEQ